MLNKKQNFVNYLTSFIVYLQSEHSNVSPCRWKRKGVQMNQNMLLFWDYYYISKIVILRLLFVKIKNNSYFETKKNYN